MANNGTAKYRLEQVEKKCNELTKKIDELKDNHIHHLSLDIISLKTRVNTATVIQVGSVLLLIAIQMVILK